MLGLDEKQKQRRLLTSLLLCRYCEHVIWPTNTTPCPVNICFARSHAESGHERAAERFLVSARARENVRSDNGTLAFVPVRSGV
jgi:hypothetical protein